MRKTRSIMSAILMGCLATVIYISCTKDKVQDDSRSSGALHHSKSMDIRRENFLTFESEEDLRNQLSELMRMPPESWNAWERERGFTSLRSVFDDIVNAEAEIAAPYYEMSDEELEAHRDDPIIHTDLIDQYPQVVHLNRSDPEALHFDPNVWDFTLAWVVNTHGIIKIGNKIYQHGFSFIKCIENGDEAQIENLDHVWESNDVITISHPSVLRENVCQICGLFCDNGCSHCNMGQGSSGTGPIAVDDPMPRYSGPNICGSWSESVTNIAGSNPKRKLIHYLDWIQNSGTDNGAPYKTTKMVTTLRALKSRVGGLWWDNDNTDIYISGYYNIAHQSSSNYQPTTVNALYPPGPSGITYNVQNGYHTFAITYFEDVDYSGNCVYLTNCYLHGDRTGGPHGVVSDITLPY